MRLKNKLLLILFSSVFAFVLGLYIAFFHLGLLEYLVNRQLRNIIAGNLPLKVNIGDIGGDYFRELVISNIQVDYDDGNSRYNMATIPTLRLQYNPSDFWRGVIRFNKIVIDSAQLTLTRGADGRWLVPTPNVKGTGDKKAISFEVQELELASLRLRLLRPQDSLIFDRITLKAALEARDNTYALRLDTLSYRSSERKFNINYAKGKASLTGSNLMLQDLVLKTDSSDLTLGGQMTLTEGLTWKMLLQARRLNLHEGLSFINVNLSGDISAEGEVSYQDRKISGKAKISGTFEHRLFDSLMVAFRYYDKELSLDTLSGEILDGTAIEGRGDIDLGIKPERYHLKAKIRGFNLNNLVSDTYETNLNGDIELSGSGLKGESLLLDVIVDLGESWFDEYHAYELNGAMAITTDSIRFQDDFIIHYKDNYFNVSGRLDYRGDIDLDGTTRFEDLSAFNRQTFIERLGGRADLSFKVTGVVRNPDIAGEIKSDSLWLYDIYSRQARIDFDMRHFLYDRDGSVNAELFNGSAYDIPFDTIILEMAVDSQFVKFEKAYLRNQYSEADSRGSLDYLSYPQVLKLDTLNLRLIELNAANQGEIVINIDSSGYAIEQCRLLRPQGALEGTGRVNYDDTWNLSFNAERLHIRPLVALINDSLDVDGIMHGGGKLAGSFDNSRIEFVGAIDSLQYQGLVLGDMYINCDYRDSMIYIDSIALNSHTGYYLARGTMPINLKFRSEEPLWLEEEQNIDITAVDVRLDMVSLLLNEVEQFTGDFRADFKLTGTPVKPKIDGKISIQKGRLKLFDLVDPIEDIDLKMSMKDRVMTIDSVTGICRGGKKKAGQISGGGTIVVNAIDQFDYDLKLKARDFPAVYELGDINAVVDADLQVRGLTPPTVSGNVTLQSAVYRENFARENEGWIMLTSLQGDQTWDLDLDVEVSSNLWIKNDDIDAEFAGEINFIREKGVYRYIGSLEILRGKGFLADRTFRIETGSTISYEDIEYPNPRLDIYAVTQIRGSATSQTGQNEVSNFDLRVHVTGTLDEPIISAAEGSQFSTEEIIPLIFTNYYQSSGEGSLGTSERVSDRITSGLSGYLSTQFTQIGSRSLGVETFEIDPVYGDKFDPLGTRLTVGFYTHPNLYIYGRSAISGVAGQEVGFEYRLKRNLLLEGRRDDEDLYHLILNLYWDY